MFEVSVTQEFAAAHQLPDYKGQCSNIHGHTWKVRVSVAGSNLDSNGMLVDFKDLKTTLLDILDSYDHSFLNQVPPFDKLSPTAENIAREIYNQFKKSSDYKLQKVEVWESERSCAVYWEE